MCNLYTQTRSVDGVLAMTRALDLPLGFPEGVPNLQPRDIRITEPGPIVRGGPGGEHQLVVRRWSWPGPGGKPVYNFRSDGREFRSGRCLIVADGFYEFTAPAQPGRKRKDRWLFTLPDGGMMGIAGLVREVPGVGEAFTMLTTEPGPDVAPYHQRQVAVLPAAAWRGWLDHSLPAAEVLGPLPAGSLAVTAASS
uniref:SOS response-associated peptidase n=1 Tax=uncultured Sphingomonas sp. TaxID=158754 RepID=UPI0026013DC9|nr:SOS response-associated peptidase [uncultured Sphingomonas sp.]